MSGSVFYIQFCSDIYLFFNLIPIFFKLNNFVTLQLRPNLIII